MLLLQLATQRYWIASCGGWPQGASAGHLRSQSSSVPPSPSGSVQRLRRASLPAPVPSLPAHSVQLVPNGSDAHSGPASRHGGHHVPPIRPRVIGLAVPVDGEQAPPTCAGDGKQSKQQSEPLGRGLHGRERPAGSYPQQRAQCWPPRSAAASSCCC